MNTRKLYICRLLTHQSIKFRLYKKPPSNVHSSTGDAVLKLWLTDTEAAGFIIEINKDYYNIMKNRSMHYKKEVIMHILYLKYPEMFEE